MTDPAPGDVPLDELQPLLDDKRISFTAVGIYAFLRTHELEGRKGPPHESDLLAAGTADEDEIDDAVRDLVLTGYVHRTEHNHLVTERHRTA